MNNSIVKSTCLALLGASMLWFSECFAELAGGGMEIKQGVVVNPTVVGSSVTGTVGSAVVASTASNAVYSLVAGNATNAQTALTASNATWSSVSENATNAQVALTASNVVGLVRITNDVIICAETTGDNIGLESITYPIGDSQTDSAWLGYSALYGSTGYHNSAVGEKALRESPGIENAAMGYSGLYTSPGSYNAAIGAAALFLSPGSFNFGAGYQAGAQSPGDSNIYIGAYAGFSSPATNAICIGVRTLPLGNNSMVLGNADTTNTHIKGNVTITNLTVLGGNVVTNNSSATLQDVTVGGGGSGFTVSGGTSLSFRGLVGGFSGYPSMLNGINLYDYGYWSAKMAVFLGGITNVINENNYDSMTSFRLYGKTNGVEYVNPWLNAQSTSNGTEIVLPSNANVTVNGSFCALGKIDSWHLSSNVLSYAVSTVSLSRANGQYVALALTNNAAICIDQSTYPTNGAVEFRLDLYIGNYSVTFCTNSISTNPATAFPRGSGGLVLTNNAYNSLLFERPYGSSNTLFGVQQMR